MKYDLVVIGSGPAGQKGAFAAAKLGKKVAIVEHRHQCLGGVCLHSGTIPSKTLREAILYLTGFRQRDVYTERFRGKRNITMDTLRRKLKSVIDTELDVIREQFDRNNVDIIGGRGSFIDRNHLSVERGEDSSIVSTDKVLVACGTRPSRPDHIPFDGQTVFDSDEILNINQIPRSMVVIGAGVIGIEYAIMFATLGVEVTVVDGRTSLLEFCDTEIVDYLLFSARTLNMRFRLGENVETVIRRSDNQVAVKLESQKHLVAETALFSVGREGEADSLNLESINLAPNKRGRLDINENYQTAVDNIYAVGDIVGFPSLASSAMEQGRRAALHAFGQSVSPLGDIPYGLYTIPEISMIGRSEQQLTAERVPYEVGIARYHEIARGQIIGDDTGMLKILFHRETLEILGVHCIGDLATEIVHIGQAVMQLGGKLDYFCDTVFNYPTMAEAYRVAAFNGMNRLSTEHEIMAEEMTRSSDPVANLDKISAAISACETPVVLMPNVTI
jgi:NAD(P) transhydrogenase